MMAEPFVESGMTFGPYPEGHCFRIETSATYSHVQQGVQMAEFWLLRQMNGGPLAVWIVEAKSSSPRPETHLKWEPFIGEIRDKLINALSLGTAACLGRHHAADAELPEPFKRLNLKAVEFRLILIVNDHRDEWLPPLQEALAKALRTTVKTWALPPSSVLVLNDGLARKYGLIA